jgi:predicted component of type VI protein secretion system
MDNFASIKNTGRDELFLIPQTATKIEEGDLTVDSTAKAQSIARNFSKYLNTKKTSRILLNRFISLVA